MCAKMMLTATATGMECPNWHTADHLSDAVYCRKCGTEFPAVNGGSKRTVERLGMNC